MSFSAAQSANEGELDWNLIDQVDPLFLKTAQGIATMRILCQQFLRATSVPLNQPERILKLFQILQVTIGYLCSTQDRLNAKVQELTMDHQDIVGVIGLQCPICMKVFEALPFLDKHIFKRHGEVAQHWRNFRAPVTDSTPVPETKVPVGDEHIRMLFHKIRDEIHKERRESKREVDSLIRERISQVERELESLKASIHASKTPPKKKVRSGADLGPKRRSATRKKPVPVLATSPTPKKKRINRTPTGSRTPTLRQVDFDESDESDSTDVVHSTRTWERNTGVGTRMNRNTLNVGGSSESDYISD